ncbi:MAG: HNH endonuclease [Rikenellaceae bacterium]
MKINRVTIKQSATPTTTLDTIVGDGYLQGVSGQLADVDIDYQSDRRAEVKEYLEHRYNTNGKQRVFSAGTMTTLKIKATLKDVARVHKVPLNITNYISAIFEDDKMTWGDLFLLASKIPKVRKFIHDYPQVIEDMRGVMGGPRSASVHASAILITPDTKDGESMECFDYTPIKKMDDILVSEFDGYSLDEVGLLKNDCLGIKELSKIKQTIEEVNRIYGEELTFEGIVTGSLDDAKTFEILSDGHTQNVFQFSSKGMTKFMMDMRPSNINDLIAAAALYRPAPIEAGSTQRYVDCKRGDVEPEYLWGTENALKDTYAQLTYQESLAQIAREVGGFSLGEGVKLLKLISKKQIDKIHAMKDKFIAGAAERGCPKEEAVKIWDMIESGGSYLFNKCISGKETIYRPHGGKWKPTIGEMYKILNDIEYAKATKHTNLRAKYKLKGYGVGFSLNEENRLVKNSIKDIRFIGERPTYRITLADGETIDVTANHKHPTQRGEVRTDCLVVGEDSLFVNVGHVKQDTVYRFTDKGESNNPMYHKSESVEYKLNSKKGHMGFTSRPDSEYVKLEYYRMQYMPLYCEQCGKENCRLEVHHINGDHSTCGETFENLITLCVSCHKKAHYKMGRRKMGEHGLYTTLKEVKSVEYIGMEEVYDVEMNAPNHTFATANGVVTCNSHATAYAVTAYVGAYLKANYPTAFYSVALQWADDKELTNLMSEMEECSVAKIVPPDVNVSQEKFFTDYDTDEIFWSLTRIKMLGSKAVDYIISKRGDGYKSLEDFITRLFVNKEGRSPLNTRHLKNMILVGCFDKVEGIGCITERCDILYRAAEMLDFELPEPNDKPYHYQMQQIALSGIGSVNYEAIFDSSEAKSLVKGKAKYMPLSQALDMDNEGKKIAVCATVTEVEERSYMDKQTGEKRRFYKVVLQQNNDLMELILWNDFVMAYNGNLLELKDKVVVTSAMVKYSDFAGANSLNSYKSTILTII